MLVQYIVDLDLGLDLLNLIKLLLLGLDYYNLAHFSPAAALNACPAATEDYTDAHQSGEKQANSDIVNIGSLGSPLKDFICKTF